MECVTALATGLASKIGELLVEPIGAQLGYLIRYDNNVNNMNGALMALEERRTAMQGMVDADKRNGRKIVPNVERWLGEVAGIQDVLRQFREDEASRNKKCLGGWCPNLNTRYSLSKRAKRTMVNLVSLREEKFEIISYQAPPLKSSSAFPSGIKRFESRNSIIKGVIEKLKDDRFKRISVCGMAGVGKTTLVKEVIKIVEAEKLFDYVALAVVSQTPNLEKIQGEIADRLGLDLNKKTLRGGAYQLLDRIKNSKVLIVLDDVWTELDFETIGLPLNEDDHKACKVIFTSRNDGTCHKMGSKKTFTVNTLSGEDSWDLFEEIIGGDVVSNPDIHPIAKEIANECGGLPIAIVTVGKALLRKKDKVFWEYALDELRKSSGSFSEVEKCIELSYNFVDGEITKNFLFLCCLFPEDTDIPIEVLMREGWGLGWFKDEDALLKARNKVHKLMDDLKTCYLLLDSDKEECVKMHDVVRDVVISIASRKENDFRIQCDAEKKWQKKSTWNSIGAISIMIDKVKEWPSIMEYPKLEFLQMASTWGQSIPINFFQGISQGTSKLKVLSFQYLSIPKVSSLFPTLNDLRTLRLEKCQIGDVSIIGKELLTLEILSFAYSNIKELPVEIGQLGSLRLLDLTGCDDLDKFSSNVLTSLSQLEELYFRIKNFPWVLNSTILFELKQMSHQLKVVELRVRKVELLPEDLIFENIARFWVYIAPYRNFNRRGYLGPSILQLTAVDCNSIFNRHRYLEPNILQLIAVDYSSIKCSMMIKHLVKRCEILKIGKVNLKNVVCELDEGAGLPLLKDLEIRNCSNLEYLIDSGKVQKSNTNFSNLVKLELTWLPSLIGIIKAIDLDKSHQSKPLFPKLETILLESCALLETVFDLQGYSHLNGQPHSMLFPQLKEIKISYLEKLTHVWGNVSRCVQGFHNLRALTISNCDSLMHIFAPTIVRAITELEELNIISCKSLANLVVGSIDGEEDDYKGKGKVKTTVFHKLNSLSLTDLPKLESICATSNELEWPSLRKLDVDECPMLKIQLLQTQLLAKRDNDSVTSYSNIQGEESSDFKGNKSRPFNWSLGCKPLLPKFIHHGSSNKRSIKEVSSAQDQIPSVFEMKSKIGIGHMPILEHLYVEKCDFLDVLFLLEEKYNPAILSYLKTIKVEECDKLETIMAKREERMDMMSSFTHLESLELKKLPNLVRFCLSGTCTSLVKQEDEGLSEGDHRMIRRDPLIDGFLFPNLTSLCIQDCNKISILFSHSTLRSLEHLEMLQVEDCMNIEEIVSQEEIDASMKIMFHSLQHLVLIGLPNLKAFCRGPYDLDLPSLRVVRIGDCPKMELFSQGSSHTPRLEDVTMEIESLSSNYIQKGDLNATIQGFKAFVALQRSEMLRWSELHTEGTFGYFIKNSKMDITMFHELSILIPFNEMRMLHQVRELTIKKCDSLVELFESEGGVDTNKGDATIPYELQRMTLEELPKLKKVWGPNIMGLVSFLNLTSIEIRRCHSLKSLLSHSMAGSLVQLEKLIIGNCDMMEKVVRKEDENTDGGSKVKSLLPKLKKMNLSGLPKMECVCSVDYDYDIPLCDVGEDKEMNNKQVEISFPELDILYLRDVPKLKCFCSGASNHDLMLSSSCNEEISEGCPQIASFHNGTITVRTPKLDYVSGEDMPTLGDLNLTIHYIQNSEKYKVELSKFETFRCIEQDQYQHLLGYITREKRLVLERNQKLLNCIPSNMMHRFQHLESLTVRQCGSLEEIFESEGVGANDINEGDSKMQYELRGMELDSLPKLKHIWKNHGRVLGFQNLAFLIITGCHDLKYVFPDDVSIAISLPKLWKLEVCECNKMEEIIQNKGVQEQQLKEAKIIFPLLSQLTLKKLPSLNCFCSSSCYVELPNSSRIIIEECPKMETFCYGTVYTPFFRHLSVEKTEFDGDEDINEVIQHIRQH